MPTTSFSLTRRLLCVLVLGFLLIAQAPQVGAGGWEAMAEILSRISAPRFPARDFDVTTFGALADGTTDATAAFRKAIEACHAAGGGRVVVPPGTYATGAIRLLSGVNLHVSEGAVVRFSRDPERYLPPVLTRFEGVELLNYSPLIYAYEQENIAVTGKGILDGQADSRHWWAWKSGSAGQPSQAQDRAALLAAAEAGVPIDKRVFGGGHYLRPSFFSPYRCRNVLIEDVTLKDAPMWFVHPVLSRNVTIRRVTTLAEGPNTDGCDPESCSDVLIEDCHFDTGDDCIALKSGRNADGRRIGAPIENVVIRGCQMRKGHGGITIGSEVSGGARNIYAERCEMSSPQLERGLRIKTNSQRGGVIESIHLRDITIGEVQEAPIHVDLFYEEGDSGRHTPVIRDIEVAGMRSAKSRWALFLRGYERAPIRGVRLTDCAFSGVTESNRIQGVVELTLTNVTVNGRLVASPTR
jgi:polygalacturonase